MNSKILLVACLALASFSARADLNGRVVGIMDGDTIDVLVDQKPVRVRLAQIDAPEKRQPFGTRARQALSDKAFNREVTVVEFGRDRYGRVLGTVKVAGQDINRQMVRDGFAWAYRDYLKDKTLIAVESEARSKRAGLWADPKPTAPWEFRANQRARKAVQKAAAL